MATHTPGPWIMEIRRDGNVEVGPAMQGAPASVDPLATVYGDDNDEYCWPVTANARLIAAAPDLLIEAGLFRCLVTSPRFQSMTVAEALHELAENGQRHDDGAALRKAGVR